jgi:hypothetical protein
MLRGAMKTKATAKRPGGGASGMTRQPRGSVVVTLCVRKVCCVRMQYVSQWQCFGVVPSTHSAVSL